MASEESRTATTRSVLEHHLTAFAEGDMAEILADYTDESVYVSNMGTFRGLDELEMVYEGHFEEFSQPGVEFSVDEQIVEGETAFLVWRGETPGNVYEFVSETFVIRDGKIATQTVAAEVTPKA